MDVVLPLRRWVAHYGRWVATVGWLLMIDGFWDRQYGRGSVGLAIGALAAWGMLLDADQPDKPRAFQRRNLTFLMWLGTVGAVFCAVVAIWTHLEPQG